MRRTRTDRTEELERERVYAAGIREEPVVALLPPLITSGTDVFGPPVALLIETASEEMETLWRFGAHMLAAYQRVAHAQVRTLADTLSGLTGTSDRTSGCSPLPVHAAAGMFRGAGEIIETVWQINAELTEVRMEQMRASLPRSWCPFGLF